MNAPAKLSAYGVLLVVALGVGAAVGAAVGPIDSADNHDEEHPAESHPGPEERR